MQRNFGMFGQIHVRVRDVTLECMTVSIWTNHELDGASLAANVRNAIVNRLRDMIPVDRFVAVYDNRRLGIEGEIHELPYPRAEAGQLRSSEILIEENMAPVRKRQRRPLRRAWRQLLKERG